jgi:histidine triad (HIT) family protein
MSDCIFCKIISKEIPSHIIDENDDVVVFLSIEGHPLVVTKKHIQNVYELDDHTASSVMKEAVKVAKAVRTGLDADGVNLIQNNDEAAGQEVFHFHLHIKPRWKDDEVIMHFPKESPEDGTKMTLVQKIQSALHN